MNLSNYPPGVTGNEPQITGNCDCGCHMPPVAPQPVELDDSDVCCDCWETCSRCLEYGLFETFTEHPQGNICPSCLEEVLHESTQGTFLDNSFRRP